MDDFVFESERSRNRFIEKAAKAGFHELMARWRPDLVDYSLNTLALVWPEEAYVFNKVIVRGLQIKAVAAEANVNVRTIHRRLAGYGDKPGAEDWFLITLQLYREADFVYPRGAEALRDCFLNGDFGMDERINACLRVFFLMLVEATAGSDVRTVLDTVPWLSAGAARTLAWPCYAERPPLEHSLLPGILAVLQMTQDCKSKLHLILLTTFFSEKEARLWRELLSVLNMGRCRGVADLGRIPPEHLAQAEASARLLLSKQAKSGPQAAVQYAMMGLLALTPLSWESLCACVSDPTLLRREAAQRLQYCSRLYLEAQL